MKAWKLLSLLLICLLGGCFNFDLDLAGEIHFLPGVSLHPLYTEKQIIFEEKLLGVWRENNIEFKFEKIEDKNSYNLTAEIEDRKGEFIAHLVKIEDMLFLDLFPQKPDLETINLQEFLTVPSHMFMKIEQIEPTLQMRLMDPDKITNMLENNPKLLKHEVVNEYCLLLTASTKQLQQFMVKHANDEGLFIEQCDLMRFEPKDSKDPNTIEPNNIDPNIVSFQPYQLRKQPSVVFRYDEDLEKVTQMKALPPAVTYVFDFNQDPNNVPKEYYFREGKFHIKRNDDTKIDK